MNLRFDVYVTITFIPFIFHIHINKWRKKEILIHCMVKMHTNTHTVKSGLIKCYIYVKYNLPAFKNPALWVTPHQMLNTQVTPHSAVTMATQGSLAYQQLSSPILKNKPEEELVEKIPSTCLWEGCLIMRSKDNSDSDLQIC